MLRTQGALSFAAYLFAAVVLWLAENAQKFTERIYPYNKKTYKCNDFQHIFLPPFLFQYLYYSLSIVRLFVQKKFFSDFEYKLSYRNALS